MRARGRWKSVLPIAIAYVMIALMIALLFLSHVAYERDVLDSLRRHQLPEREIAATVESHVTTTYLTIGGLLLVFGLAGYITYQGLRSRARWEEEHRLAEDRRQLAETLRESEKQFHLFYEQAPVGYQSLNEDGCLITVNQAWLDVLGYTRQEVVGQWFGDFLIPEQRELFRERFARFKQVGEVHGAEFEVVRKDGTRIIASFEGKISHDEQGRFEQSHCVLHDVTARRRAEEALRASAANYREIFNSVNDAIFVHDMETGEILDVNRRACELYGYKREELLRLEVGDISSSQSPHDQPSALRWIRSAAVGDARVFEWLAKDKNGMLFWAEVNLKRASVGGRDRVLAVVRDITERKQAEAALRAQRDFAENLIETAHAVVAVFDMEGNILRLNRFGEKLLGWAEEEVRGKEVEMFCAPNELPRVAQFRRTLRAGQPAEGEIAVLTKDRRELSMRLYASPLRDGAGHLTGVLCIAHDITELKQKEEQLRQAQKMEAVGCLAGGIAHDFNNQLTVIKGYCDLLLKGIAADSPLQAPLEEIRKAAVRSAALTNQLLSFSRRQMLRSQVINLNDVLSAMEGPLSRMIGEDVALTLKASANLDRVSADPNQVEQAVMNLVVNARDAMPRGGRLTIETANVDLDEQYVRRHADASAGPHVMLAVSDTGHGMDRQTVERVFEPFFTTKAPGHGTGLGLSMVYGFVRQSGGHVTVYSEPGSGTTFKIYLPRVDAPAQEGPQPALVPEALQARGETILVTEDDAAVRGIIVRVLRGCGYDVLEASAAQEAISVSQRTQERISLLVTDVVMPGMKGPELVELLKDARPAMKVLYVSGYADGAFADSAAGPGARMLMKPFTPDALAAAVRSVLDEQPAPGQT